MGTIEGVTFGSSSCGQSNIQYCSYCGAYHNGMCPKVRSIEYYPNGTIKTIEFFDVEKQETKEGK